MLVLSRKENEAIFIDELRVSVLRIIANRVRLAMTSPERSGALVRSLKTGETFTLDEFRTVTVVRIGPRSVRLGIDVPRESIVGRVESLPAEMDAYVYLPDAHPPTEFDELERIQDALGFFLESFGFAPEPERDPTVVFSSWSWRQLFRSLSPIAKEEGHEIFVGIKEALRRASIDKLGAEAFDLRAKSASDLIQALEPYENAIVRLGDVILAKAIIDGQQRIVIETVSAHLSRQLESNPILLKDPVAFIEQCSTGGSISGARKKSIPPSKAIEE